MPTKTVPTRKKFDLKMGMATREAFGKTLAKLGAENTDIVVCDADLSKSTYTHLFAKEFPDRFFECGIAEANMVAIGAGLASSAIARMRFGRARIRPRNYWIRCSSIMQRAGSSKTIATPG